MKGWSLNDLNLILKIAESAGQKILKIYQDDQLKIKAKYDGTPLTNADMISHKTIQIALKKNYKEIPILSEEGKKFKKIMKFFGV